MSQRFAVRRLEIRKARGIRRLRLLKQLLTKTRENTTSLRKLESYHHVLPKPKASTSVKASAFYVATQGTSKLIALDQATQAFSTQLFMLEEVTQQPCENYSAEAPRSGMPQGNDVDGEPPPLMDSSSDDSDDDSDDANDSDSDYDENNGSHASSAAVLMSNCPSPGEKL